MKTLRTPQIFKLLFKNVNFVIGFVLIISLAFLGFVGPILWPAKIVPGSVPMYQRPSGQYWLGTDAQGRPVFNTLLVSIGQSLLIGLVAGAIAFLIGTLVGLLTGYHSGILSDGLTSVTDVILIIPTWPILVLFASLVFKMTIPLLGLILAVFSWSWSARRIKSLVKGMKEQGYVEVARMNNENSLEIVFKEIMPNILPFLFVNLVSIISWTIISEVGLEIVGLGPQGTSTLGLMLYWVLTSHALTLGMWWWVIPTILCLVLIFVSLQVLVIGLDEVFNPRLRT